MSNDDPTVPGTVSRRGLLKSSLTVAAGAAGGALAANAARATQATSTTRSAAPRKFRAYVSRGVGRGRTTLQELTLRPISGRQVVVRTEAASLCYFNVATVLGMQPDAPPEPANVPAVRRGMAELANKMAMIQGHGGVGIVEAVGPDVRRVKPGDRVCVSGTPQCGVCYQCLRGRADMCQFLGPAQLPPNLTAIAEMRDGTPVYGNSEIGGLAELMVTPEEWVVPIQSTLPAAQIGMVCSCVSVAGLGATTSQGVATLAPGSVAAVVGCGPLGLSAVQGARIAGASTIIAVDPIRARRELALKLGATFALDPNAEGEGLVAKVQEISMRSNPSVWGGGRNTSFFSGAGADYVVEAVGAEWVAPRAERYPDPTGVQAVRAAYDMVAVGGQLVTTGVSSGTISFPAAMFNLAGHTHHSGQAGGCSPLRDIPRFVNLLESGRFDAKSMLTSVVPFEHVLDAYEAVAYRTTVFAIMTT